MNAAMTHSSWGSGVVAVAIALVAGCRTPPPATAGAPGATAAPRPWLVTIVVDQLAAWMADERWPALPSDGGFARLLREGLYLRELRFAHAVTETAPGHAALYTGAVPRVTGIVSNDVLGPDGKKMSSLLDPRRAWCPRAPPGRSIGGPARCALLKVDTLADALVAARPGAEVYSFSLKDRGALFGGGRRPKLALWLDTEGSTLARRPRSRRGAGLGGAFADAAAVKRAAEPSAGSRSTPAGWQRTPTTRDDQEGEGDYLGWARCFPTTLRRRRRCAPRRAAIACCSSSRARPPRTPPRPRRAAGAAGAVAVLARLRRSRVRSRQLGGVGRAAPPDRGLAELFAALDALVGPAGYAVMLTGDHGSMPLPEIARAGWAPGAAAARAARALLAAAVRPRRSSRRARHRAPAGREAPR